MPREDMRPGNARLVLQCREARQVYGTLSDADMPNPGLLLGKFVQFSLDGPTRSVDRKTTLENFIGKSQGSLSEALKLAEHRHRALEKGLRAAGLHVEALELRLGGRMIVGLGTETPLEVGITLDRLGLPYIPASSLKGLARYIAEDRVAHGNMDANEVAKLFGSPGKRGVASFYDAYPVGTKDRKLLELDVMNPHFSLYYGDPQRNFPTDDQQPNPIMFAVVPAGTHFRFFISSWDPAAARHAADLLYDGLTFSAAGAKKAAGYGWFLGDKDGSS